METSVSVCIVVWLVLLFEKKMVLGEIAIKFRKHRDLGSVLITNGWADRHIIITEPMDRLIFCDRL